MSLEWKKIKEESYRAGWRKMLKRTFLLPNGTEHVYDITDDGDSSHVLAFTKDNRIIMEKIFRPGPEKVIQELPGGIVEEGEDPKDAMERELMEETGYKAESMEFVGTILDDAYRSCTRYVFVARGCEKVADATPESDEGSIEVITVTLEEFRKHLRTGQMSDVEGGYLALDYLGLL